MDGPLLNLDTLIVRPFVEIDGRRYDILSPDEISVMDSHRFGIWGRRIQTLAESDDVNAAEELDGLYAKVARAVLIDVPEELFAKLTGAHMIAVADVFTGLLLHTRLGVAGAMAKAMGIPDQPIGESSSPASSASMVEPQNGGLWTRLLRWFART
jgi:hypothetical protein